MTQVEERAEGQVARSVYLAYIRSWGPALLLPVAMLLFFSFERGLQVRVSGAPARQRMLL